jgi:hypothetical protein
MTGGKPSAIRPVRDEGPNPSIGLPFIRRSCLLALTQTPELAITHHSHHPYHHNDALHRCIMTVAKDQAAAASTQSFKPMAFKRSANHSKVWASIFHSTVAKQASLLKAASAVCNIKATAPPIISSCNLKGAVSLPKTIRRVHFAPKLVSSSCVSLVPHESSTWYDDDDYLMFKLDSRRTVQKAQEQLLAFGDWRDMDPTEHSLLGLEHFLSPTLERERMETCRAHARRILQDQQQQRQLQQQQQRAVQKAVPSSVPSLSKLLIQSRSLSTLRSPAASK